MPYKTGFICDSKILETIYSGVLTTAELQDVVMNSLSMAEEKNTNSFFGDCTAMDQGGSLFDIYELGKFFETIPNARYAKEAIVLPISKEAIENMQFYETTARNRGFDVRVFQNRREAISWLIAAPEKG